MPKTITLSDDQVKYLNDIMDNWIEGHEDAFDLTIDDPMFEDAESMLNAVSGLNEQIQQAVRIKAMLV
jgi:hypothetical protein